MSSDNPHVGSSLDDFLKEEGIYESAKTAAVKEAIAFRLAQEMKDKKISKRKMAAGMHTSRSQLDRILDPEDLGVTLLSLQKAAEHLGKRIEIDLV
jgi:antitoxin HicB